MSQYLHVLVTLYPFEGVLDRNAAVVDQFLSQCITDANSEARANGRKSFLVWQKLAPTNAQNLFAVLDYQAQKAIVEEQDRQEMGPSTTFAKKTTQHSSFANSSSSHQQNFFGSSVSSGVHEQEPV